MKDENICKVTDIQQVFSKCKNLAVLLGGQNKMTHIGLTGTMPGTEEAVN